MLRVQLRSVSDEFESRIVGVISTSLTEVKRVELIKLAKNTSRYSSKITSDISVDHINVDDLLRHTTKHLDVYFKIRGYNTVIRFENFITELRSTYSVLLKKSNKSELSKNQKKTAITKALVHAIDNSNIRIQCSCADFIYRFAYVATQGGYKLGTPETRPANKTNPNNSGSMCKHLSAVVGQVSRWQKVVVNDVYKLLEYDSSLLVD